VRALLLCVAFGCSAPRGPVVHQLPADARLVDRETAAPFFAAERYRGRVVVLDFWAGWCAECKRTVPQVQRLAAALGREGLVVVGVNAGDSTRDVATYAREFGIDYPIALDPDLALSDQLAGGKLPLLVVLDRDGTIVHRAKHVDQTTLRILRKLLHAPTAR